MDIKKEHICKHCEWYVGLDTHNFYHYCCPRHECNSKFNYVTGETLYSYLQCESFNKFGDCPYYEKYEKTEIKLKRESIINWFKKLFRKK